MSKYNDYRLTLPLDNTDYQTILKASKTIAFMYDPEQQREFISPYVGEILAGNYDGRLLFEVMIEDGVIHPDDVEKVITFRELVLENKAREIAYRLKTPEGEYRWFRIVMSCQTKPNEQSLFLGLISDIDERIQYQEEYDPVSGILSRTAFLEQLETILHQKRSSSYFLFQFDIERFKLINELYGTVDGNKVLHYIGHVLRGLIHNDEICGRLRDDLFCSCVHRSSSETVSLIKLIQQTARQYRLDFRFFLPTGIVEITPDCTETPSGLCDMAMLAKKSIKGNYLQEYCFYTAELGERLNREHLLIVEMERSLKEHQFEVWFQPQYDMRDGRMIGAEALTRWRHPTLGKISPMEFIPLFERNGFIIKLDRYIWEEVCRFIRKWRETGLVLPPICVNISRVHLHDMDFGDTIIDLCSRYDVLPSQLWLEITESAYIGQFQSLYDLMKKMKSMGFRFAMDDFGSGYSSLNSLKDIPVDLIKFDLKFLDRTNNDDQAGEIILKKSVQLTEELGLTCLAEGVETSEQARFLQDIGCYQAQGYYYAKPMPLEDFEMMLKRDKGDELGQKKP